ncbi:MAG: hypothetical protein IT210_02390 [Armatimonadetes bacterium]|nr:hypothetical protein [Armatimonadota bacterium]
MPSRKHLFIIIGIFATALSLFAEGEKSASARLLPVAAELKGWQEIAGGFQYGKGDTLTEIYNGGYNLYVDRGVLEAAQKLYRKGSDILTVTPHLMKDAASARSFVAYWKKTNAREKIRKTPAPGEGFTVSANGATMLYWSQGRYFLTAMSASEGQKARGDLLTVLKIIAKKAKGGK